MDLAFKGVLVGRYVRVYKIIYKQNDFMTIKVINTHITKLLIHFSIILIINWLERLT